MRFAGITPTMKTMVGPLLPNVVILLTAFAIGLASMASWTGGAAAQEAEGRYDAIADILQDDEARARLIEDLRALGAGDDTALPIDIPEDHQTVAGAPSGQAPQDVSLARQIAEYTQSLAEGAVTEIVALYEGVLSLEMGQIAVQTTGLLPAILDLAVVVITAVVAYYLMRAAVSPIFRRASAWVLADEGVYQLPKRIAAIVGAAVVDGMVILLAWVAGYAVALFAFGQAGEMDTRQSLFLNAFLLVEFFKLVLRILFSSRFDGLRLLPVAAEDAAFWNKWLARVSGLIGYGLLVAVPIINFNISPIAGRLVSVLIMLSAFLYAMRIILGSRDSIRERILRRANEASMQITRTFLTMVGNLWHWVAIGYFAALTLVTLFRPEDALPFMAAATGQTVVAVAGGIVISMLLTRVIVKGVRVPEQTRHRLPMLEGRLNSFVPLALKVIRILILIAVIALVADAWALFDAAAWMASEMGVQTVAGMSAIGSILFVAILIWIVTASWIEHRLSPETGKGEPGAREKTLLTIFRNAFAVVLITMTTMITLSEIGLDIGPLIAGAGVLGLAIGFGAQTLVQDIITGVFIQLENAMNTGDVVTAGGTTGTVERLTIRSVGIRDLSGTYHVIPFSAVSTVSNYMREFGYHVGEYGIAYRENTDDAIVHLRNAFEELRSDADHGPNILGDLEVHGVTSLGDSAVNVRVRIKAKPGTQWSLGRAYNRLVKRHFDAAGIEIPYPHMTLYFGEGKDGQAPAAPIRILDQKPERPAAPKASETSSAADNGERPPESRSNPTFKGDFDESDR